MGRRVGVVLGVRRLPQHRHVVIQGQDHVLRHDRVQQAEGEMRDGGVIVESNLPVEIEKEGDHLPGEMTTHLDHVLLDHARVVYLSRIIFSWNRFNNSTSDCCTGVMNRFQQVDYSSSACS